jgi:hypothetical protein
MSTCLSALLAFVPLPLAQWSEPEAQTLLEVPGDTTQDAFGWLAFALGDVDGDGAVDFVTCAPLSGVGPSAGGLVRAVSGADGSPLWQRVGHQQSAILGFAMEIADWNGDGVLDVIAGAPFGAAGGRVTVFEGASGTPLALLFSGAGTDDGFGCALDRGDFDGDGVLDLAIGALAYPVAGIAGTGRAVVISGANGATIATLDAPSPGGGVGEFGVSLAFLGDVSQPPDGRAELAVGERDASFFAGELRVYSWNGASAQTLWSKSGVPMDYGLSGNRFDGGLDVDGDGLGDLLVSATQSSQAQLLSGADGAPIATYTGLGGDNFGSARLLADLDGDGSAEVLLGASGDDNGAVNAGRAFLRSGATGALLRTFTHTGELDRIGREVRGAGDVDGDGPQDFLLAGTGGGTGGAPAGRFLVVRGTALYPNYCAALPNSTGAPASISASGQASLALEDLVTFAAPVPSQVGIFFHGAAMLQVPFGNGVLCVGNGIQRSGPVLPVGQTASWAWDGASALSDLAPFVGQTRHFQYWFRDTAAGGANFNTSNAMSIEVLP